MMQVISSDNSYLTKVPFSNRRKKVLKIFCIIIWFLIFATIAAFCAQIKVFMVFIKSVRFFKRGTTLSIMILSKMPTSPQITPDLYRFNNEMLNGKIQSFQNFGI